MKLQTTRNFAAALACLTLMAPSAVWAGEPPAKQAFMRDVALKDGGMLVGAVLNPAGKPQANVAVHCISGGKVVATAKSDDRGRFAFNQLRGGVLQLQSSESVALVRVWAPRTAPPNAQQGVMLVHGGELVRGQEGALLNMFSNPYFLGGLAAVAIAAPLAIAAGS